MAATVVASAQETVYFTALQSFDGVDGESPAAARVQANDGKPYGRTTVYGGDGGSHGSIFRIDTTGKLTTIYGFCSQSGCADQSEPSLQPEFSRPRPSPMLRRWS
jgi:hypothetical protein